MSLIEQVFATIGIASTILLVIQLILLLIGLGGDTGGDTGGDAGGDAGGDMGGEPAPDVGSGDEIDFNQVHVDAATGDIDITDMQAPSGDWYGDALSGAPDGDFTGHSDTPVEFDHGAAGLRLFTLQGLLAFFVVFSWSGLVMLKSSLPTAASIGFAIVFGIIAMVAMALIYRAMLKLQQEGTLDIRNALGKSGTVYLKIPAKRENTGKVSLVVQDRLIECDAVTDDAKSIPTGAEVTVIGVSNKSALIVRKK
mgnify:CR=1 FL=1